MEHDDRILLARIDEKVTQLLHRGHDHEKRLRNVEKKQWAVGGAATLISLILAYAAKKLGL